MDYENLAEWQVVSEILHNNPESLTVLQIANRLGITDINVYKWGQDPEFSGTVMPKKYEIPFSNVTGDKRLFEWKASQIGYRLKPLEIGAVNKDDIFTQFLDAGNLLGKAMGELKISLVDGKLDDSDKMKLRTVLDVLIRHCQGIKDSIGAL